MVKACKKEKYLSVTHANVVQCNPKTCLYCLTHCMTSSKMTGLSISSGSRVEANILKLRPEIQEARQNSHASSPIVQKENSPLRESSDFPSEDSTTSCSETPDASTMSSFFYSGPFSVTFKAMAPTESASNKRFLNSTLGPRSGVNLRAAKDPKLLEETP